VTTAVLLALPEHGHLPACLPVAAELCRRGVRVVVYGTPEFQAMIIATGSAYRDYGAAMRPPPAHEGGLYSVMAYAGGLAEAVLPTLLQELRELKPDLLLLDAMCLWGQLAQQVTGTLAVTLAPVFVPHPEHVSDQDLLEQAYGGANAPVLVAAMDGLNTYFQQSRRLERQYGVTCPDLSGFFAGRQKFNVIFTARAFHPGGAAYGEDYLFAGPQFREEAEAAAELEERLPAGPEPLIYISLGTIFHDAPAFYRECLAALGEPWCRVVLALGERVTPEALGALPAHWRVAARWPQRAVLQRAAAFITHAGMNSATEGLWAGVPLLCVPQHGDQFLVAQQVAGAGAGLVLAPESRSAGLLRASVERVLNEAAFAQGARRMGEQLRAAGGPDGGAARAATAILAFVNQARGEGA